MLLKTNFYYTNEFMEIKVTKNTNKNFLNASLLVESMA